MLQLLLNVIYVHFTLTIHAEISLICLRLVLQNKHIKYI